MTNRQGVQRVFLARGVAGLLCALASGVAAGEPPPKAPLKPHPKAVANAHPPGEVDIPANLAFVVDHAAKLPGIVVDEMDAKLEGVWQYSTHTPPYVGLGYLHDQKSGKGKKSVTYQPRIPADGWYEVRMSHCYNVRRAVNTPTTIRHADGETTLRVNQQQRPAHQKLFRTLGVFRFQAGTTGWVQVSNEGTGGKYVIADAVQWLPARSPDVPRSNDASAQGAR